MIEMHNIYPCIHIMYNYYMSPNLFVIATEELSRREAGFTYRGAA